MKTVNFIEAVNSGNRFRCHDMDDGVFYKNISECIGDMIHGGKVSNGDMLDLVNMDFTIEETFTFTEYELEQAYINVNSTYVRSKSHLDGMKKQLGIL